MNDTLDTGFIIKLTSLIVGSGMAISTLEYIANIRQCKSDGLFSWDVWREAKLGRRPLLKRFTHPIFSFGGVLAILLTRLLLIAYLLFSLPHDGRLSPGLLTALVVSQLYLNIRFPVGKDGSDQMSTIVLFMLFFIAWFPDNRAISNACIAFIAFQSIASYLTAGIAKLISPEWQSGDVILEIMNTKTYGSRFMAHALQKNAFARRALNYGTMAFEALIFLVFFLPHPYSAWFLAIPLAFHLGCALCMGLNSFVFAFAATFPSVLYVSSQIHRLTALMDQCI